MAAPLRPRLATLATCNLCQWALDFEGNLARIQDSIARAKAQGATYRVGPELEVPGYGCEDHFQEQDTVDHSWECIIALLHSGACEGILCDVGAPVVHCGVRYNCRLFLLGRRIVLIRPKLYLADDGNYRESRYFATWKRGRQIEEHTLPLDVQAVTGQATCPLGAAALVLEDAVLAAETCEELFTPQSPNIALALGGVEIVSNGSGSHHQLRKLHQRLDLMRGATARCGGVYLYANQQGCDGGRLYYDGCAAVLVNGELVAQGSQFGLAEVEVVAATVDLSEVVSHRAATASAQDQASGAAPLPAVRVSFALCARDPTGLFPALPRPPRYHSPEEEIALGPSCWLWDYLRRSGAAGFLLPLSGGADSSAVAAIVCCLCRQVAAAVEAGDAAVEADARRVGQYGAGEALGGARGLAARLFTTAYLGSANSSAATRRRAAALAAQIGADHVELDIDSVTGAVAALFSGVMGRTPRFRADGGSAAEGLALQNIQARLRMVLAFLLAQLRPWTRGRAGFLLVLGAANVDECLRGYLTKYDCSSADLNPIGAIAKGDLRRFLAWAALHLACPVLEEVAAAAPTAELEPLREGIAPQTDEADMGMTYEELGIYGRLRKVARCGPVSMFRRLLATWHDRYSPGDVAERVKAFFRYYALNRHKATTLTPAYHAESYSPDDNRYDHRPFLYDARWPWQFAAIDALAARAEEAQRGRAASQEGHRGASQKEPGGNPQGPGGGTAGSGTEQAVPSSRGQQEQPQSS